MSNPLMSVMLNNTINKWPIDTPVQKELMSSFNLREEQGKLLKEILTKNKSDTTPEEDNFIAGKGIKLITLEELKGDYQRVEPVGEKKEAKKENKNLVSLASIGKLYKEVK